MLVISRGGGEAVMVGEAIVTVVAAQAAVSSSVPSYCPATWRRGATPEQSRINPEQSRINPEQTANQGRMSHQKRDLRAYNLSHGTSGKCHAEGSQVMVIGRRSKRSVVVGNTASATGYCSVPDLDALLQCSEKHVRREAEEHPGVILLGRLVGKWFSTGGDARG